MENYSTQIPLAERLRPKTLGEFLGQNKIMGPQSLLRKSLENDCVPSMIFWGPPGCGKTTLAHIIKEKSKKRFISISAVSSGVKELKTLIAEAREPDARKQGDRKSTRLNSSHQ